MNSTPLQRGERQPTIIALCEWKKRPEWRRGEMGRKGGPPLQNWLWFSSIFRKLIQLRSLLVLLFGFVTPPFRTYIYIVLSVNVPRLISTPQLCLLIRRQRWRRRCGDRMTTTTKKFVFPEVNIVLTIRIHFANFLFKLNIECTFLSHLHNLTISFPIILLHSPTAILPLSILMLLGALNGAFL